MGRRVSQMIDSHLDTILDRSVVGGYTSVGYRIRSRAWQASDVRRLEGKVVLVSGATSGIGLAAAEGFARLGASVRLLVRSDERGAQARAAIIERTQNSDVRTSVCDLSSLESVRGCTTRLAAGERVHMLVNNAGVMTQERALSADGIELTLATNSVRRPEGVRAHEARAGDTHRNLGAAAGGHRGRGPRDAPGLGGHPRRAMVAASLLQGNAAAAQNARAGRRHDRMARSCDRTEPQL